ncbi:MAG: flagellar basal body-associated FliL family protein [Candidatus Latescibacterota bacterium]|nr:flagellar basal body-associated FliL family protein [Candidatus Latescibacterota bacterium]
MAEEAAENGNEEASGDNGDGGVLKKWGPLAGVVCLVQVVLAWVLIQFVLKDNVPDQPSEQLIPETQEVIIRQGGDENSSKRLPFLYVSKELDQVTANPAGTNAERFVVLGVQLGLEAYDHDQNPKEDITADLKNRVELIDKISDQDPVIKGTIVRIMRAKTVDELDAGAIDSVLDEIRKTLNAEIFDLLFVIDEENKIEIRVAKVNVSSLMIQ